MGWFGIFLVVVGVGAYCVYEDSKLPPQEVRDAVYRQEVADTMPEVCVKGVVYYSTTGAHNVRLAPAVDEETLQFKRCK